MALIVDKGILNNFIPYKDHNEKEELRFDFGDCINPGPDLCPGLYNNGYMARKGDHVRSYI